MSMILIEPINAVQQQQVVELTADYIDRATAIFARSFSHIPVTFDLTGRAAGMYRVDRRQRRIRYNPYLFSKYFEDNLSVTVPHEVAHYIADRMYGMRNIRPHGREWLAIMHTFGAEAKRTCNYDLEGIPVRRQQRYSYQCGCRTHHLTSRRHNKIIRDQVRYFCKVCGGVLNESGKG
jgi:SprT protein